MTNEKKFVDIMRRLDRPKEEIDFVTRKFCKRPSRLYRYRPLDANNEKQLTHRLSEIKGNIRLTVSQDLNDPMDMYYSSALLDMERFAKNVYENFGASILGGEGLMEDEIERIVNSDNPMHEIAQILGMDIARPVKGLAADSWLTTVLHERFMGIYKTVGVACFAETPYNTPMWYNYASGYNEICLEYESGSIASDESDGVFPVIYTDKMPIMNDILYPTPVGDSTSEIMNPSHALDLYRHIIYYKTSDWNYEREWRMCTLFTNERMGFKFFIEEEERVQQAINSFYEKYPSAWSDHDDHFPLELQQKIMRITAEYEDRRWEVFLSKSPESVKTKLHKRPSKIYLGHKLAENEDMKTTVDKIVSLARSFDKPIPVFVMQATIDGYRDMPYDEFLVKHETKIADKLAEQMNSLIDEGEGEFAEALQVYEKSLSLKHHASTELHYFHTSSLMHLGHFDVAHKIMLDVLAIKPDDMRYHVRIGDVLRKKEHYREAAKAYSNAIRIYPLLLQSFINLAICHVHLGEYDEAISVLYEAKSIRFTHAHEKFTDELHNSIDFGEVISKFPMFKDKLLQHLNLCIWDE